VQSTHIIHIPDQCFPTAGPGINYIGSSSYRKKIYRAVVWQRLRTTALDDCNLHIHYKFHSGLWGSITMAITLPCLHPCDYFLCGSLKDSVFQKNPYINQAPKIGIQSEIKRFSIVTVTNFLCNYIVHLCNICELWEYHFEHDDMTVRSWNIGTKKRQPWPCKSVVHTFPQLKINMQQHRNHGRNVFYAVQAKTTEKATSRVAPVSHEYSHNCETVKYKYVRESRGTWNQESLRWWGPAAVYQTDQRVERFLSCTVRDTATSQCIVKT
jgi:hypothetical protein